MTSAHAEANASSGGGCGCITLVATILPPDEDEVDDLDEAAAPKRALRKIVAPADVLPLRCSEPGCTRAPVTRCKQQFRKMSGWSQCRKALCDEHATRVRARRLCPRCTLEAE